MNGSEWSGKALQSLKIYLKFENEWKAMKCLDWSEMFWKIPKNHWKGSLICIECPERVLMLKGFDWSQKVSQKVLKWKGPKLSWKAIHYNFCRGFVCVCAYFCTSLLDI